MRNPNGYGTITKLSGNRRNPYAARTEKILVNNTFYSFYIDYFSTKSEAKTCLEKYNTDINYRNSIIQKNLDKLKTHKTELTQVKKLNKELKFDISSTVEEVFENYKKYKFSTLAEKTQKSYLSSYNAIISMKDMIFSELSVNDIITEFKKQKLTYSVSLKCRALLKQMYDLCILEGLLKVNYAELISFDKNKFEDTRRKIKLFTKSEIDLIWSKKDSIPFLKVILIMLYTGIRTTELLNLKNHHIDLENRTMRIEVSKTESGENRLVPISKKILPLVKDIMNENEYFISNNRNKKMKNDNFVRDHFKKSLFFIGLEHNPHETRHTFISMINRLDINDALLSKIVGHKSSLITINTYTHKEISDLISAIDKLDGEI
ncbi:tyrosine-type recombinase/integrase [Oceanivirga miroungae]|uniref:Integrase family protein n=1 Tax=Oceanivirga miroungae TaxID=1130046 RepID=A0A6I8M9H4_9FUSO|nr:tyrosine-type recombinase/integrase [Oceanivirga miroungae]VWL84944.1 integrase family protein [Oceanivirga miroungae]